MLCFLGSIQLTELEKFSQIRKHLVFSSRILMNEMIGKK